VSASLLYGLTGIALFCISLRAVVVSATPVRAILAVNVMSSSVFLVLVALATRSKGLELDPVTHAMVITAIVVAVSATAMAIVLVQRLTAMSDPSSPDDATGSES